MMNNTAELQLVDNSFYPDIQGTKKTVVAAILYNKRFFVVALDMLLALLTVWMAFSLRLELLHTPTGSQWLIYLLAPLLMLPVFIYSGLYQAVYRHSGFTAFVTVVKAVAAYGLFFLSALMSDTALCFLNQLINHKHLSQKYPLSIFLLVSFCLTHPYQWFVF